MNMFEATADELSDLYGQYVVDELEQTTDIIALQYVSFGLSPIQIEVCLYLDLRWRMSLYQDLNCAKPDEVPHWIIQSQWPDGSFFEGLPSKTPLFSQLISDWLQKSKDVIGAHISVPERPSKNYQASDPISYMTNKIVRLATKLECTPNFVYVSPQGVADKKNRGTSFPRTEEDSLIDYDDDEE